MSKAKETPTGSSDCLKGAAILLKVTTNGLKRTVLRNQLKKLKGKQLMQVNKESLTR